MYKYLQYEGLGSSLCKRHSETLLLYLRNLTLYFVIS